MRSAIPWVAILVLIPALSGCFGGKQSASPQNAPSTSPTDTGPVRKGTLTADFDLNPLAPVAGQRVQFTDRSKDTARSIVERAWDFGDGQTSTVQNPTHVFAQAGRFEVKLRVKNDQGTEATALRLVRVLTGPAGTNAPAPEGSPGHLVFGAPVTVQETSGGEPSLAIDAHGRIYVNPIGKLYRSDDEGQSWAELKHPTNFLGGSDSHVVVDKDERVWTADLLSVFGVSVWSSADQGQNWLGSGNPAASESVLDDRQWLAAPGGGVGYLFFRFPGSVHITKTTDAGLTWLPLNPTFDWTSFPFVNPKDGTLYVAQAIEADAGGGSNAIKVAVSTDGGSNFNEVEVSTRQTAPTQIFISGDVDDAGNAYVAWIDGDSGQQDVWMASSTNRGQSWSAPVKVSSGLGTRVFPWITAGADGRVVVVWYGTSEVAATSDDVSADAEWKVYAAISHNADASQPVFAEAPATGVIHKGSICTQGTGCGADDDRDLLDFFVVDLMPDGRAAIVYAEDGTTTEAKTQFILQTTGPLAR